MIFIFPNLFILSPGLILSEYPQLKSLLILNLECFSINGMQISSVHQDKQ